VKLAKRHAGLDPHVPEPLLEFENALQAAEVENGIAIACRHARAETPVAAAADRVERDAISAGDAYTGGNLIDAAGAEHRDYAPGDGERRGRISQQSRGVGGREGRADRRLPILRGGCFSVGGRLVGKRGAHGLRL
jgi:hypothetical protein